jgi:hypothetical protein
MASSSRAASPPPARAPRPAPLDDLEAGAPPALTASDPSHAADDAPAGAGVEEASLFVTTLNMGGVKSVQGLGAPLSKWIPHPGACPYDLIVVGLQECLCLRRSAARFRPSSVGSASHTHR